MEQKNDFSTIMTGRRSVRVYDETYKIPHEEMLEMIKEATTAPSSVNMQPWRFVVAESEEAKEILRPLIRFNTRQNDTSSAMVMIFGDMQFMLVARDHGYETNPIGGFEADQLAEAFGLDKDRYVPVIILSIGKAVEEGYESVRLAPEKITTFE
ncbi:TPA: nitroreductase family protein [Enterococcus faecium]|nr:nitroreductase family protein [Enterococcus faecium]HDO7719285.1 nitroreductase family protein [Enterococcus faecium]HDO7778218.1 nitroreductase family protein [Enterococcus faecium]HDO7779705.1 nitroreductase family protein [Enterococcus faecium]